GHYGTGAAVDELADWAGVSVGSVYNCARRCMVAIATLHGSAIIAIEPEQMAAARIRAEAKATHAWRGGIFAVDGTPVPLAHKPGFFGVDFYGKDKLYAIQAIIIILIHNLLIVDYAVGKPGSAHDATGFKDTYFYKHHEELLQSDEWIWADSAFTLTQWLITPFKAPRGKQLTRRQRRFNYYLSKIRVAVEHAIGLLKIRWQSLKELRIHITDEVKLAYATMWIRCCIVLHNLVIRSE
ncbi:hypothetical protein DAEQUDRAFT_654579, partial [Daedalea quercina L-15889]